MKVTNIIRILQNEIIKGNDYIAKNGNICNESYINNEIKREYLKKIDDGSLDMTISLSDYMEYEYNRGVRCSEVIDMLSNKYGIKYISCKEKRGI